VLEALQLLDGAGSRGVGMADVELHHLVAGTVAGVGHIGAHGAPAADGYLRTVYAKVVEFKI